jgi:hypothetical protein
VNEPTARVLVPAGMLGGGFPAHTVDRGIALGADVIAVDGGSTDSGPHYLATGTPKTTDEAVTRDLRMLLGPAQAAGTPLIIGSCGTAGTDDGVDWVASIVEHIADQEGIHLRIARLYSEQDGETIRAKLAANRIVPLEPAGPLDEATVRRCERIVGLMGHEPIVDALERGADVILAGRCTDTAVIAAVPLMRGCPPGPTWHAAKTAECGGMCTTNPRSGGVIVTIDSTGFTIEHLEPNSACTTTTVAAHMLYANVDPFRMREPTVTLDTSRATYTAIDDRTVRVEGSRFEPEPRTMKLEGAALAGYQTLAIAGIRDPDILTNIDTWTVTLHSFLVDGIHSVLGLDDDQYRLELRCYGHNAVLGQLEPDTTPPREVGVMVIATAAEQALATKIAKYANPYLLHMPLPTMDHLPTFAFMSSPAEIPRGPIYEFVLQHAVALDTPLDMVRLVMTES